MRVRTRMVMRRMVIMKRMMELVSDDDVFIMWKRVDGIWGSDGSWCTWLEIDCIMERRTE